MENGEMVYLKKKVSCPKCGHVHTFAVKTDLSLNNFSFSADCVSCGALMAIDQNSIFRNSRISSHESSASPPHSYGLESLEETSSKPELQEHSDISSFFEEDDSTSSKAINDLFG